jgi:hypothetical protein
MAEAAVVVDGVGTIVAVGPRAEIKPAFASLPEERAHRRIDGGISGARLPSMSRSRTAQRRGRDRMIRVPRSPFRPRGVVYSSAARAARESRLQFSSSSPPASRGGGRAG